MAFKGFRFAGLAIKDVISGSAMKVVLAAIAVIPCLYGALYLAAFMDPFGSTGDIPVAVVNLDEGAQIAGVDRNVGDEVCDDMAARSDGLKWDFVSADEAREGMQAGAYYMICTIPADFSEKIASAETGDPKAAELGIEYDQSQNMLASQMGQSVWQNLQKQVEASVAQGYWEVALAQTDEAGKSLDSAAQASSQLAEGAAAMQEGNSAITQGLSGVAQGAGALQSGLGAVSQGGEALSAGMGALAQSGGALSGGVGAFASGIDALSGGADALVSGTSALAAGSSGVSSGAAALAQNIAQASEQAGGLTAIPEATSALVQGAQGVDAGLAALGESASAAAQSGQGVASASAQAEQEAQDILALMQKGDAESLSQARSRLEALVSEAPDAPGALALAASGSEELADGLSAMAQEVAEDGELRQGSAALAQGASALDEQAGALPALAQGLDALAQGAGQLAEGAGQLDSGVGALASQAPGLAEGVGQLSSGANGLASGLSAYVDGVGVVAESVPAFVQGISAVAQGTGSLVSGADALATGSEQLGEGMTAISDGNASLAEQLDEGASGMRMPQAEIEAKAEMMADPVQLDETYYTEVDNYGTGFAPYFMALGLWVGCLVAGFAIRPLNNRLIVSGANPFTAAFAGFAPLAAFALVQGVILLAVLQFALGLQIENVPQFYAFGLLASLAFAAIMQLLMAAFGFPGRFIAIILLMLQLTSAAGTFPIEATSGFFQAISPLMPMTYVVEGMRQIMCGIGFDFAIRDAIVLGAFGVASFLLTVLVAYRRRAVRIERLHPVLKLG